MDKQQTSYTQMFAVVRATCNAHDAAWNSFVPFKTAFLQFDANFGPMHDAISTEARDSTGQTIDKEEQRDALEAIALRVMDALILYAHLNDNDNLRNDVGISPSMMSRITEDALVGRAKTIHAYGTTHAADLVPYGITAAELTELDTAITDFTLMKGTPGHLQNEAERGGKELDRIIAEQNRILTTMDLAANVLKATQPTFVEEYFLSREIIDPGYGTRALTVTIVDYDTREPLAGAVAVVNPGGISKTSGEKGMFYIDTLESGDYTIAVTKAEYMDSTTTITIDGTGQKLEIALQRA